jgi:hypothetical protein
MGRAGGDRTHDTPALGARQSLWRVGRGAVVPDVLAFELLNPVLQASDLASQAVALSFEFGDALAEAAVSAEASGATVGSTMWAATSR